MPSRIPCRTDARVLARSRGGLLAVFAALTLLTAMVLVGCGADEDPTAEAEGPPPAVEAVPARSGTLPLEEELSGVVKARNQVAIQPEIEGVVREVLVRNGEAVQKGQALVRIAGAPLGERVRQGEASLRLTKAEAAEARANLAEDEARTRRVRALAEQDLVSQQELETAEAQLEAARARAAQAEARVEEAGATLDERRADLSQTVVRSPISGRVGQRNVEVGMVVDPSSTLFLVGEFDDLVVEVPLTERLLAEVDVGTSVVLDAPSIDEPIGAELSRISPFLEASSFSTTAEIDVDNREGTLRPGMFVNVRVLYGETERATLVPASSVWEDPRTGRQGIYVIRDPAGLAESSDHAADVPPEPRELAFRPVEVRAEARGTVGVRGVEDGEWVVTVGQHLLRNEAREQAAEGETAGETPAPSGPETVTARVRPTSWDRVVQLQRLQREDLLDDVLEKQRKIAAALGTEIPESEDEVDRILNEEAPPAAPGGTGGES